MSQKQAAYRVTVALWPEDLEQVRSLLTSYGDYLAASPAGGAGVCIPGYQAELASLPGKYQSKDADLLLARVQSEGAGCVAVMHRVLTDGLPAAEIKRLWVEPRFRGLGVGRGLVLSAIEWARAAGCRAAVLDTVAEAMPEASRLYQSMGFEEVVRFNDNPVPGVRFYRLIL